SVMASLYTEEFSGGHPSQEGDCLNGPDRATWRFSPEDRLTRRLAKPLFWAAAAFAYVMAILPHPPSLPVEPGDTVQHVIAFPTLGFLASWAYASTSRLQLFIRLSLFGAFIELCQAVP